MPYNNIYIFFNTTHNRRLVTFAESDHGKQTNSSTKERGSRATKPLGANAKSYRLKLKLKLLILLPPGNVRACDYPGVQVQGECHMLLCHMLLLFRKYVVPVVRVVQVDVLAARDHVLCSPLAPGSLHSSSLVDAAQRTALLAVAVQLAVAVVCGSGLAACALRGRPSAEA